ncbi:hypothetical protein SAMN05444169_4441 [Bradyrhizobium erythrophlei]|uniref:Uncharacterized protein n=1 Tax=Bradyrhizobium erythrophlei TaxID=1437360 RepID=A0A1M5N6E9_9BRAD|nr:hypothetical protein SAMN05444169_4441 [Bradyrhizobium erythrophlei]
MADPTAGPERPIEHAIVIYAPNAARLSGRIGLIAVHFGGIAETAGLTAAATRSRIADFESVEHLLAWLRSLC